ncbi:Crp/Fnr family transcriptional regulator [Undibacterium sp.]|uniref:Crp/Fnr family transcriptional regulator n=1 Tax=Undibacterium sp. TaxID=1914977 RepID=UPI002731F17A|nr:Crp/Fnr family transcriptional regulator [Undibacterium sp.]MDP1980234.1 Crp/Fnr family transcriptional regulator [Undibacterium sp.]
MNNLLADPWFASLPMADRKFMLASCEHLRLRRGEMLFRQGDQPSGFYALLSGSLKMSTLSAEGREAILIFLEAATWFGEISLIDDLPRTHDATALTEVELLVLAPQVFRSLMQRNSFANAITRMLAKRIRLLYGIVEDAGLRSVRARVARRLLLLAEVANRQQDGHAVVPVTQEALAMMLGMTRQTLSKELRFFKQDGLIRLAYGKIEILSESKLSALCDKE